MPYPRIMSASKRYSRTAVSPLEFHFQDKNQGLHTAISGMEVSRSHVTTVGAKSCEHQPPSSIKKPVRERNPEIAKLNQRIQQFYEDEFKSEPFWSTKRREQLHEITTRVFVGSIIAGMALNLLTSFWRRHFASVVNVYPVTVWNNETSSTEYVEVKSPFIADIKDAEKAFFDYFLGLVLLLQGSLLSTFARCSSLKLRSWLYLGAILLLLASIALIVSAPLLPLLATNNPREIQKLMDDEYVAFKKNYKGSIRFFRKSQCDDIEKFIKGKDQPSGRRMMFFCDMLSRLVYFLYFMGLTAVIPFVVFIFCWLEVIVNKRYWDMKTPRQYKPRTLEQIAEDKSRSATRVMSKAQPELENMY